MGTKSIVVPIRRRGQIDIFLNVLNDFLTFDKI